jgi:hypothetical protein
MAKYPADITGEQWACFQCLFLAGNYGKSRRHDVRTLVNSAFYAYENWMPMEKVIHKTLKTASQLWLEYFT